MRDNLAHRSPDIRAGRQAAAIQNETATRTGTPPCFFQIATGAKPGTAGADTFGTSSRSRTAARSTATGHESVADLREVALAYRLAENATFASGNLVVKTTDNTRQHTITHERMYYI